MLPHIQSSNRRPISGRPSLLYQTAQVRKRWRTEGASLLRCGPTSLILCLLLVSIFGLSGFFYGVAINTLDLGTGTEHAAGFGFRKSVSKLEQNLFKAETSMIHARDHPPSEGFPPSEGRPPSEASSPSDERLSGKPKLELKRQQAFKGQHGAKLALGTVEKEPGKDESTGLPGAQQGAPATIMLDSLQQGEPATMAQTGQKGSGEPAMQHGGVSSEAGQHARSIDASTTVRGMDEVHKKRARRALSLLEESIAAANYACDDGTEISIDKVHQRAMTAGLRVQRDLETDMDALGSLLHESMTGFAIAAMDQTRQEGLM